MQHSRRRRPGRDLGEGDKINGKHYVGYDIIGYGTVVVRSLVPSSVHSNGLGILFQVPLPIWVSRTLSIWHVVQCIIELLET